MEEKISKLMKNLSITREEALQVLADDKAIDKGEKLFELTDEQKKAVKKVTRADSKPRKTPTKKEPKEDKNKAEIMQVIDDALCDLVDNVEERVNDRELLFTYNGKKFKIVLSCPRN